MSRLLLILLAAVAAPALADRLPLPADTPAVYRNECGSCHLPYPPALLAAADWQRTLAGLKQHFGSDASLSAAELRQLEGFLSSHAGSGSRVDGAGEPPRITRTARFTRKHREVPERLWRDARVKSAANCEACHRAAGEGRYSEHDLLLPELRGRH